MLLSQQAKEKADILGIMARMEMDFQETEADAKHEYSSLKDDAKNKVYFSVFIFFRILKRNMLYEFSWKVQLKIYGVNFSWL